MGSSRVRCRLARAEELPLVLALTHRAFAPTEEWGLLERASRGPRGPRGRRRCAARSERPDNRSFHLALGYRVVGRVDRSGVVGLRTELEKSLPGARGRTP